MPTPKKKKKGAAKMGRPVGTTTYTKAVADKICERLANGESLKSICRDASMPPESTVRLWASRTDHPFAEQYARARELGFWSMADELLDIADDGSNDWMVREGRDGEPSWTLNGEHVQRSKLRLDQRRWLLSRMMPKTFGDKVTTEHTGADGGPIQTETNDSLESARRVAFLLGTAVAKAKARSDEPSD